MQGGFRVTFGKKLHKKVTQISYTNLFLTSTKRVKFESLPGSKRTRSSNFDPAVNKTNSRLDHFLGATSVGSIISFRVGAEDAKYLAREFHPFAEADFISLPNYNVYLRLMVDGATSRPFSATTHPLEAPANSFADEIRWQSRRKHGKPRGDLKIGAYAVSDPKGSAGSSQINLF